MVRQGVFPSTSRVGIAFGKVPLVKISQYLAVASGQNLKKEEGFSAMRVLAFARLYVCFDVQELASRVYTRLLIQGPFLKREDSDSDSLGA